MKDEYNCKPENIIACICPSIRVCHFEVDTDVMELCKETFAYTNRLDEIIKVGKIKDGKQKYNIDTVLITKILLEDEKLKSENEKSNVTITLGNTQEDKNIVEENIIKNRKENENINGFRQYKM